MSDMHDTGNAIIAANGIRSIPGTSDSFKAAVDNIIASLERAARIEQACLIRREIDAPPEAFWWERRVSQDGEIECWWLDEELDCVPIDGIAPNYSVNGAYATLIRLPIIDC